jgi:hypothetical protein
MTDRTSPGSGVLKFLCNDIERLLIHAVRNLGDEKRKVHHDDVLRGLDPNVERALNGRRFRARRFEYPPGWGNLTFSCDETGVISGALASISCRRRACTIQEQARRCSDRLLDFLGRGCVE